jgi:hypothetical protein
MLPDQSTPITSRKRGTAVSQIDQSNPEDAGKKFADGMRRATHKAVEEYFRADKSDPDYKGVMKSYSIGGKYTKEQAEIGNRVIDYMDKVNADDPNYVSTPEAARSTREGYERWLSLNGKPDEYGKPQTFRDDLHRASWDSAIEMTDQVRQAGKAWMELCYSEGGTPVAGVYDKDEVSRAAARLEALGRDQIEHDRIGRELDVRKAMGEKITTEDYYKSGYLKEPEHTTEEQAKIADRFARKNGLPFIGESREDWLKRTNDARNLDPDPKDPRGR